MNTKEVNKSFNKKKIPKFWQRVFYDDRVSVRIGSEECPICKTKFETVPLATKLGMTCPECHRKLVSVR